MKLNSPHSRGLFLKAALYDYDDLVVNAVTVAFSTLTIKV